MIAAGKNGATVVKSIMEKLTPTERLIVRSSIFNRVGKVDGRFSPLELSRKMAEWPRDAVEALFTGDKRLLSAYRRLDTATKRFVDVDDISKVFTAGKIGLSFFLVAGPGAVGILSGAGAGISILTSLAASPITAAMTAKMMTSPGFINWLSKVPNAVTKAETPKAMEKLINELARVGAAEPEIRQDILNYIDAITPFLTGEVEDVELIETKPQQNPQEQSGLSAEQFGLMEANKDLFSAEELNKLGIK